MDNRNVKKSIFRALFVPLILIMVLQSVIFYMVAVYGGIEDSLNKNATEILSERLYSRKSEIDAMFNNRWSELTDCVAEIDALYSQYEEAFGVQPICDDEKKQISFLGDSAETLIDTLRFSRTNGIFLIINNSRVQSDSVKNEQKYGLCIRDMDQESDYSGTEDLLLERGPSSLVDSIECPLDSWWEARYSFENLQEGIYYYAPINAAWEASNASGKDLAYVSLSHRVSGSDPEMLSYSIPLVSSEGYPYAVLGIELSVKYLCSLLPGGELNPNQGKSCYILAMHNGGEDNYKIVAGQGALFNRCFGNESEISGGGDELLNGQIITGRDGKKLYAKSAQLETYNTNNPFSERKLMLLAVVESDTLFSYITMIKTTLLFVAAFSLLLGIAGITLVSRRFAAPITALAGKVHDMEAEAKSDYSLERLGILEIDQLVDSIEELNKSVSRDSARTEFFSRMSHDMRTPMNAIISFSSKELLENADEHMKDDYLDKIHVSGKYLLGLINEVLDMTKIESEKTELHINPINAMRLFETGIPIIEKLAQKKSVLFSYSIDVEPNLYVMADEQHINQVLMNLLSNAVKFTPEGGAVTLKARVPNEGTIRNCQIIVSDTGVGMSRDFMQKLYTPFAQEGDNHEGTGLGLSIAKKLAVLMGGDISCKSEKNVGTTFTVTMPFEVTEPIKEPEVKELSDISKLKGKKVLICEDNEINTQIIVNLLNRVGIISEVAENGKRGVEMFSEAEKGTYSAILMDIRMPVMDGLEATREIRAMKTQQAMQIPIIAMTADAFTEDKEISIAAGMNEHLSKPVEPNMLYELLLKNV